MKSSGIRLGRIAEKLGVLLALGTLVLCGCGAPGGYKITPIPADRTLEESQVLTEGGWLKDKIALIDVSGMLMNDYKRSMFSEGENPVSFLTEKLNAAAEDTHVKAVVLRINTPGGTVTASDLMHEEIKAFKKRTGKPVVAMMLDVAASGGYYIACACDEIVAHPTTVTGSIGVIMITLDVHGALEKLYIKTNTIKTGPFKDSGSPFREMSEEDRKVFQGIIDNHYQRFLDVVAESRTKLTKEKIKALADGRVYTASEARRNGLVDRVGEVRDAIAVAKEKSTTKPVKVIMYHRPLGWTPNIYAASPMPQPSTVNLINVNLPELVLPNTPSFMYLWAPGR